MQATIRQKIEMFFSQVASRLYDHRIKTLIIGFAVISALVACLPATTIDTSAMALLRKTDPARIRYDEFRNQFNENDIIVIAIQPDKVFDRTYLSRLKALHEDIERNVPYVKQITSLINARDTRGEKDLLVVGELLENWPETTDDIARLKADVFGNPLYQNYLISEDGTVITIVIETEAVIHEARAEEDILLDFEEDSVPPATNATDTVRYFSEKENRQVVAAINRLVDNYNQPDFAIAVAGDSVVLDVYNRAMERDIVLVIVLSLLTIAVFLSLLFRRVSGVLLPEIIIVSGLFSTVGLMALFNVSIKLTTIVLPGFLLAVSVGYSVHILSIFYVRYQGGKSKRTAISEAVAHSGLSVVLTGLTTAASLFSFAFAELRSIADLGFFGATGVLLALLYTLVLLPPMIAVIPIKRKDVVAETRKSKAMDRVLLSFSNLSTAHPRKIVAASLTLFAVAIFFTFQVRYSHNVLNWIHPKEKIKTDVPSIDQAMKGSIIVEAILDSGQDEGLYNPHILHTIDGVATKLSRYVNDHLYVGKIFSINDIIKEINQSLNANDPDHYRIPDQRDLISQELLLFENSGADDLERVVDSNYRKTRIGIKTPWTDAVHLRAFIAHVQEQFNNAFPNLAPVTVTGIPALLSRSIPAALHSMAQSYLIAFVVITFLMMVHVGSVKLGLLSMISNLLPIFMTTGLMGALGIRLDMSTIMIGSIAIGIVVDDTLHFMYNFRKYYERSGDTAWAIRKTMLGTGRALLLTSLILSSGFFILMTASLSLLVVFGLLTGLTIIFALLADFLVNPALMVLVTAKPESNWLSGKKTMKTV